VAGEVVVAAAQVAAVRGDVAANLATHLRVVGRAAAHGARLVVFPELSLTGYELDLAGALRMAPDDLRLAPLAEASRRLGVHVMVGAPWGGDGDGDGALPFLGAFLFTPGGTETYAKVHVHVSEAPYVAAGTTGRVVDLGGVATGLAICRDTMIPAHAAEAAGRGAELYVAGVMKTVDEYPAHAEAMARHARDHGMATLTANYTGTSGDEPAAGRSAVWDERGRLVAEAPPAGEVLVVARRTAAGWSGEVVPAEA
jgi:predicted amidohydrolase